MVRSPDTAGSSNSGTHKTAVQVSSMLQSHLRLNRGRIHFQAHVIVGRIQSFVAGGLRVSASFWLLARDHPEFLESVISRCHVGSHHGCQLHQSQQDRESCSKWTLQFSVTSSWKWHLPPLPYSTDWKQVRGPARTQGEGLHKGVNTRKWGSWAPLQSRQRSYGWLALAVGENHLSLDRSSEKE